MLSTHDASAAVSIMRLKPTLAVTSYLIRLAVAAEARFAAAPAWVSPIPNQSQEEDMLIEILVVLAIIALALFIWRNMVGRRV